MIDISIEITLIYEVERLQSQSGSLGAQRRISQLLITTRFLFMN